jgi:hypothetical protein
VALFKIDVACTDAEDIFDFNDTRCTTRTCVDPTNFTPGRVRCGTANSCDTTSPDTSCSNDLIGHLLAP